MKNRLLRNALLLACAWASAAGGVRGQQPAAYATPSVDMDLAAYEAALDRLADSVERLGGNLADAETLKRSLPRSWTVRAGQDRFEVPLGWLSDSLGSFSADPKVRATQKGEIARRLAAMRKSAAGLEKRNEAPDAAQARAALQRILQDREFRTAAPPSWWERAQAAFWHWVGLIFDAIFGRLGQMKSGREVLVWVLIAIIFILLTLLVRRFLLRAARSESMRIESPRPAGKTWNEWGQQALRAAAEGDYRKALHAAYWAGVFRLGDLGVWEIDRSRTPREYLRLLETSLSMPAPAAEQLAGRVAALSKLTRQLESAWYGFEPATAADFRDAVANLEAIGCRFPSNLATAKS